MLGGNKLDSLAIVRRCLLDHTFSRFGKTPTCDTSTDGQTTDRHWTVVYTALAQRRAVKMLDVTFSRLHTVHEYEKQTDRRTECDSVTALVQN